MPDQERDVAAFEAWWARFAETYPLAKAEPKIKAAALLAWQAALASVATERQAGRALADRTERFFACSDHVGDHEEDLGLPRHDRIVIEQWVAVLGVPLLEALTTYWNAVRAGAAPTEQEAE